MTRALAPCLAVLLAACASSPGPSSPPPSSPPPPVAQEPATPPPTAPSTSLSCQRDEDCTVYDDCGECKPLSVHTRMEPVACSEVHGPGCRGFIPHCNVQSHTCELHAIDVQVES